jgi:hypothetical protein
VSIQTRTFKGAPGAPKAAVDPVNRLVTKLNEAGYGCALNQHDLKAGKFYVTGDTERGFAVTWHRLGGLVEVSA